GGRRLPGPGVGPADRPGQGLPVHLRRGLGHHRGARRGPCIAAPDVQGPAQGPPHPPLGHGGLRGPGPRAGRLPALAPPPPRWRGGDRRAARRRQRHATLAYRATFGYHSGRVWKREPLAYRVVDGAVIGAALGAFSVLIGVRLVAKRRPAWSSRVAVGA